MISGSRRRLPIGGPLLLGVLLTLVLVTPARAQDTVPPAPDDEALDDADSAAELEAAIEATGSADRLGAPVPPPDYRIAPSIPAIDRDAARLARLAGILEAHAQGARGARFESGVLSLVAGGVMVAGGVTMIALDEGTDPLFFILGGLSMALGLGTATTGLISLLHTTAPERRYASFERDRARGALDSRRLGRYEGALWAEAEGASDARMFGIASSVLLAANGIVQVAFTAQFAPDDTFRAVGYALGGVYVALGVLELALAFQESDAERRFREYEGATRIAVRPWAGSTGGGVVAAGIF